MQNPCKRRQLLLSMLVKEEQVEAAYRQTERLKVQASCAGLNKTSFCVAILTRFIPWAHDPGGGQFTSVSRVCKADTSLADKSKYH